MSQLVTSGEVTYLWGRDNRDPEVKSCLEVQRDARPDSAAAWFFQKAEATMFMGSLVYNLSDLLNLFIQYLEINF